MSKAAEHVEAFNQAVASGDWDTFSERFAADATLAFAGIPVGPFEGRTAIAAAYHANPPTEPMSIVEDQGETVKFQWASGDTGSMTIAWAPTSEVQSLTVAFD